MLQSPLLFCHSLLWLSFFFGSFHLFGWFSHFPQIFLNFIYICIWIFHVFLSVFCCFFLAVFLLPALALFPSLLIPEWVQLSCLLCGIVTLYHSFSKFWLPLLSFSTAWLHSGGKFVNQETLSHGDQLVTIGSWDSATSCKSFLKFAENCCETGC